MHARTLGWAGVQLRDGASSVVIDPLADPQALFAVAGELAKDVPLPELAEPEPGAVAGLLTHLHRDHADAGALRAALAPGAPVLAPVPYGGDEVEEAGLADAEAELRDAGLELRTVSPWETVEIDGWAITALPAADGLGDPQVSWLVRRGDVAVVHAGDTLAHGWWWRIARRAGRIDAAFLPINAAVVAFPHRQPAIGQPVVMDGRDAAAAAQALGAATMVPMHYGAFAFPPFYVGDEDALDVARAAAGEVGVPFREPELGAWFEVAA